MNSRRAAWTGAALAVALALAVTAAAAARTAATTVTLTFAGLKRTAIVHVAPSCARAAACPLLLVFHGTDGNGAGMERITGFDAVADAAGFVVAYPSAVGTQWNLTPAADPAFAKALVAKIRTMTPVGLVYAAGYSQGGGEAQQADACNPGMIAGLGIVAQNLGANAWRSCGTPKAVPVVVFHGTKDPISDSDDAPASADRWAALAGCHASAVAAAVGYTVQTWTGCTAPVASYAGPWGHVWPGGTQRTTAQLGVATKVPVASQVIGQMVAGH